MNCILVNYETKAEMPLKIEEIAIFLHEHLDEFKDSRDDILKALNYALDPLRGGFILLAYEDNMLSGAVVINATGMEGYIPSNILVYIAVHKLQRGKGLGKILMKEAIRNTTGGIALHVEPSNPAKFLYEKLGFTNKYLEMRYTGETTI